MPTPLSAMTVNKMDKAKTDRLARIKKLLNLAHNAGASEHEAATALEMAQRMMAEAGISADDLAASEAAEHFAPAGAAVRVPVWENMLAGGIAGAFACSAVLHLYRFKWSFIGVGSTAEIAGYAFDVLRRQCLAARAEYINQNLRRVKVRNNKIRRADLFCQGWVSTALAKALPMRKSPETQRAIDALKSQKHGPMGTVKAIDRNEGRNLRAYEENDRMRGAAAGRQADYRQGVRSDGVGPELIGGR